MFARVTHFQYDPSRKDDVAAKIAEIKPQVKKLPGVVEVYAAWQDDGHGVITAIYRSRLSAMAAAPQALAILRDLSRLLTSTPRTETYDHVEHLTG